MSLVDSHRRRPTIFDLVIIIAVAAVALTGARAYVPISSYPPPQLWWNRADQATIVLLVASLGACVLRLLPPRPPISVLATQPGSVALLAVVMSFSFQSLLWIGSLWNLHKIMGFDGQWWSPMVTRIAPSGITLSILSFWLLIRLQRQPSHPADWVERIARAIAWLWIARQAAFFVSRALFAN